MRYQLWSLVLLLIVGLAGCSSSPVINPNAPTPRSDAAQDWAALMTNSHNTVRARLGLPALQWSNTLASYSQEWANHLATTAGCKMIHRVEANNNPAGYGENLFWSSPVMWDDGTNEVAKVSAARVARDWAAEDKYYDYASDTCAVGKQCGHYTQMVWRDTRQLGCGMAYCPNGGQIWVCSYDPPGNWVGQRPY
ncbi:MAG: CAP domain-containing protein [Thiofilum sp.]|uniref:CAP domain-containing protein n=1 Tax=Thiofilum sp. TaxID=2212733 RepID=UPI0025E3809F|nr:CAP domain-containing protein [Thiofilum sp.]MBK8452666.1 SCP-like extracellular [Thiofilum sp.]